MASMFTSSLQSNILSLLLSRLPLQPLDIPQQSSFSFKGKSGPTLSLSDLTLDIEKLQNKHLPPNTPFNIRHAFVKELNIYISTNGIRILINGVDCVVSPKTSLENGELRDPTDSIFLKGLEDPLEGFEGMMESVVGFVDAVSALNSFPSSEEDEDSLHWNDEVDEENNENEISVNKGGDSNTPSKNAEEALKELLKNDLQPSDEQREASDESDDSSNNSLTKYVLDYIVGKISVELENLTVKIIADPIVLGLKINNIQTSGSKVKRECCISGITISVIKPKAVEEESNTEFDDTEEKSNYCEDNSDDDMYDDEMMSSSFLAESREDIHQSIMESAMYTVSGKSVYMSATQGDFSPTIAEETIDEQKPQEEAEILLLLDSLSIVLEEPQKLSLDVGNIKVSFVPVPKLAIAFCTLLIQSSKQKFVQKSTTSMEKSKNTKRSKDIILERFSVSSVNILLNSRLTSSGMLLNQDAIQLHLNTMLLQRRSPNLIQGYLKTFEVKSQKQLIYFDDSVNKHSDIRMEIQIEKDSQILSIIMAKTLISQIDYDFVQNIINIYNDFIPLVEKLEEFNDIKDYHRLQKARRSKLSLRNSMSSPSSAKQCKYNLDISINLSDTRGFISFSENNEDELIDFYISPINYDSNKKYLANKLIKIGLKTLLGDSSFTINNLEYKEHKVPVDYAGYDVNTRKPVVNKAKRQVCIDSISWVAKFSCFSRIKEINRLFRNKIGLHQRKKKKVKFGSSGNYKKLMASAFTERRLAEVYVSITSCKYIVSNIITELGDITGSFLDVGLGLFSNGAKHFSIKDIFMNRSKDTIEEVIIERANKWENSPMLYITYQNAVNIYMNYWLINYSGKWLSMFENTGTSKDSDNTFPASINPPTSETGKIKKKSQLDVYVSLVDVCFGLRPVNLKSGGIVVFHKANADIVIYNDNTYIIQSTVNSISLLLIDDVHLIQTKEIESSEIRTNAFKNWNTVGILEKMGYVSVGSLSTALIRIKINNNSSFVGTQCSGKNKNLNAIIDVQLNIQNFNLEVCCDSMQCLLQLVKDLKKPIYFSYEDKYKERSNELNIFDGVDLNYFDASKSHITNDPVKTGFSLQPYPKDFSSDEDCALNIVEGFYDNVKTNSKLLPKHKSFEHNGTLKLENDVKAVPSSDIEQGNKKPPFSVVVIPLKCHISILDTNIKLHDGYDWSETRNQIKNALERVANTAKDVKNVRDNLTDQGNHEIIIEETLYQSILVEIGPDDDPRNVYNKISNNIEGRSTSTKRAQTIDLGKSKRKPLSLKRSSMYKVAIKLDETDVDFNLLSNSEPHLLEKPDIFSPDEKIDDSEYVNQIDITINELKVLDNIPTSSWNMFAGYMIDAGEREIGKSMVKVSVDLVRPIAKLAAVEMILHVSLLPLRLYVDQDTLDFLTRFGEFKDKRFMVDDPENEEMFIQKAVVDTVKLKLDYKPKVIDYVGIRSGHTGEFVNFFILDGSDITLNKITLYGVAGFSKLNYMLNDHWSPDVKKNQLVGVLSGLAPIRSIINIGLGVNSLVSIPIKEYKKDGRIIRSLQVGALEFSKATSGELLKFGAKLAAGTQTILENTEAALGGSGSSARVIRSSDREDVTGNRAADARRRSSTASFGEENERDYHRYFTHNKYNIMKYDKPPQFFNEIDEHGEGEYAINDEDYDEEDEEGANGENDDHNKSKPDMSVILKENQRSESYIVSLYSNQPGSFNEGLKDAVDSIQKNFNTAKDAIYDARVRASEAESTSGAVIELAKATPVVFIRPVIAATEALSKALLGGVNDINPNEKVNAEEKYKKIESGDDHGI